MIKKFKKSCTRLRSNINKTLIIAKDLNLEISDNSIFTRNK